MSYSPYLEVRFCGASINLTLSFCTTVSTLSFFLLQLSIMEAISTLVRVGLPNYLSNLPIPETVGGWFSLGVGDWVRLIPFGAAVGGLSYLSLKGLAAAPGVGPAIQVGFANEITQVSLLVATYISSFRLLDQEHLSKVPGFKPTHVNNKIKKDAPKVVDTIDMEDLGDKVRAIFLSLDITALSLRRYLLLYSKLYCLLLSLTSRACSAGAGRARSSPTATVLTTSTTRPRATTWGRLSSRSPPRALSSASF